MGSLEHNCLHKKFRPKTNHPAIKIPGWGNCSECEYNPEENKKCDGYFPITVNTFEVKDKRSIFLRARETFYNFFKS